MGDPGCFDSGSVYALERHFPLRWRRGVAAGDCARGSRIGRRLFRREDSTCARRSVRTPRVRVGVSKRFFAETAGSVHGDHTNNLRTEPTHTDARARRPSRTPHGTRRPAQEQPRSEPVAAPHLPFPRPVHVCIHVISNTSGDRTGSPRCLFTGTVSRSQNWNSSSASQPFARSTPPKGNQTKADRRN